MSLVSSAVKSVVVTVTLALATAGALALPAPAGAAAGRSAAAVHQTLPKRTVTSEVVKVNGKLFFKGKVSPEHAQKAVFIQKKDCRGCAWHGFTKVTTSDASRYRARIYAPRRGAWFWRAKVLAYGGYAESYSGVWKTYVI
jgi:hypothetical protein